MSKHRYYEHKQQIHTVKFDETDECLTVTVGETEYQVMVRYQHDDQLVFELNGERIVAHVVRQGNKRYLHLNGQQWLLEQVSTARPRRREGAGDVSGTVTASMPGTVLQLFVTVGDMVSKGDPLLILEAMKMEIRLTAPLDGRVNVIQCTVGDIVEREQMLVTVGEELT